MRHLHGIALLALLAVSGCLPKQGPVMAPQAMDVAVVPVVAYADRPEITGVPSALSDAMLGRLQGRNLDPQLLPASDYAADFESRRATLHRLTWLAAEARSADLVLLAEIRPRYFSLLSGRYRWTVEATLTLTPPDRLEEAVTADVQFPVFMEFHHEQEEQVLEASTALFERHLDQLLDQYLGGLTR